MKPFARIAAVVVLAIVVMGLLYFGTLSQSPGRVDCLKVFNAAKVYALELRTGGVAVPDGVSLRELIARKLLKPEDVSGFKGVEVTVYLNVDTEDPKSVLMRAYFPDGNELVALVDGSVQEVPKKPSAEPAKAR
jgi:predicted HAD superfamily Cof-like phosphohydrolase